MTSEILCYFFHFFHSPQIVKTDLNVVFKCKNPPFFQVIQVSHKENQIIWRKDLKIYGKGASAHSDFFSLEVQNLKSIHLVV